MIQEMIDTRVILESSRSPKMKQLLDKVRIRFVSGSFNNSFCYLVVYSEKLDRHYSVTGAGGFNPWTKHNDEIFSKLEQKKLFCTEIGFSRCAYQAVGDISIACRYL